MTQSHQPTLAVFLANYNQASYLRRAIDSVLSQSRQPDEFYISDDASTDGSVEIIRSYVQKHPSIRFIYNEKNKGVFSLLEEMLNSSHCSYYYGGAADDCVLPGFFDRAMSLAEKFPDAGIISGKFVAVDAQDRELMEYGVSSWDSARFVNPQGVMREWLLTESPMHSLGGATIYRMDALKNLNIDRLKDMGPLWDTFATRAIALKYGMAYFPELAIRWTLLPNSMSQTALRNKEQALKNAQIAEKWMRDQEFRAFFPSDYVDRWSEAYKKQVMLYHSFPLKYLVPIAYRGMSNKYLRGFLQQMEKKFRKLFLNMN